MPLGSQYSDQTASVGSACKPLGPLSRPSHVTSLPTSNMAEGVWFALWLWRSWQECSVAGNGWCGSGWQIWVPNAPVPWLVMQPPGSPMQWGHKDLSACCKHSWSHALWSSPGLGAQAKQEGFPIVVTGITSPFAPTVRQEVSCGPGRLYVAAAKTIVSQRHSDCPQLLVFKILYSILEKLPCAGPLNCLKDSLAHICHLHS